MTQLSGRVWKFGDDINTDLLMPMHSLFKPVSEQWKYCMEASRPGWVDQVQKGDILIAGHNFGTGSGRPASRVLRDVGIACIVAESINGLFFRNCVNYAVPALEIPGITMAFEEGDTAEIDFAGGAVKNARTGESLTGAPWPPALMKILEAGGVMQLLVRDGLVEGQSEEA